MNQHQRLRISGRWLTRAPVALGLIIFALRLLLLPGHRIGTFELFRTETARLKA